MENVIRLKLSPFPSPGISLLVNPTPERHRDLVWINKIAECHGDGHILPRSLEELRQAAREGRLSQAERTRVRGTTLDLPCATAMVRDDVIYGHRLVALCNVIVGPAERDTGLVQFCPAQVIGMRLALDDRVALAVTAITAPGNVEAENALKRIFAVPLTPNQAHEIHPALGARHDQIVEIARVKLRSAGFPKLWILTGAAIRHLLQLAYEASGPDGIPWPMGRTARLHVRLGGPLSDRGVRDVIGKMADGKIPLPVDLTDL